MVLRSAIITTVAVALSSAGCAEAVRQDETFRVRDSAEIQIVNNYGPMWPAGALRIDTTPQLVISLGEDDAAQLEAPVQLPNGMILSFDRSLFLYRAFDGHGKPVGIIGSKGD